MTQNNTESIGLIDPANAKGLERLDHHLVGKAETCTDLFAEFHHGDAIEKMKLIPSRSVNLILCDPPFGTTACDWDQLLAAAEMWAEYDRILAPNGMIVLHAAQPFSLDLIMSNRPWFRQQLIWKKNRPVGFLHANRRHMVDHEEVLVFARPGMKMTFNPQGVLKKAAKTTRRGKVGEVYRDTFSKDQWVNDSSNYPRSVLAFDCERHHGHPTQKPQPLAEYLIRTFSNPGDVVLDHCYGSGTTGAAAMVTGRSFIGVERDQTWFEKGRARTLAVLTSAPPSPIMVAANGIEPLPQPHIGLSNLADEADRERQTAVRVRTPSSGVIATPMHRAAESLAGIHGRFQPANLAA